MYCKVRGPEVRRGNAYNSWWLLTDLDSGSLWQNQYVSAFALTRWDNDEARANDGTVIPDCESASGGAGEEQTPTSSTHTLNVQWEQQSTGYTCGPTTVRMLLSLHDVRPSIADISAQAGTTTDGTYRTGVAAALNHCQDGHEYQVKNVYMSAPNPPDIRNVRDVRDVRDVPLNDVKGAIKNGWLGRRHWAPPGATPTGPTERGVRRYVGGVAS